MILSQFKRDIQNEEIEFGKIALDKVGITNVLKKIEIIRNNFKIYINGSISAYIFLPETQRGIHMSRSAESIENVINHVAFQPVQTIEEFCSRICSALLKQHAYTNRAEVELVGTLILSSKPTERDEIQQAYEVYSKVILNITQEGKQKYDVYVGIWAEGMTACPCAQEMSKEYAIELIKSRPELKISEEQINKIVNLIPIASHNQRAKAQIIIGNHDTTTNFIDLLELIKVIELSMSGKIQSILKRPEEAELVRMAHLKPVFAEDVARNIAVKLSSKKFAQIPDDYTISIKVISYESIHHHDVYCELNTTFKEIREKFNGTKNGTKN